jgi:hypothetical protein
MEFVALGMTSEIIAVCESWLCEKENPLRDVRGGNVRRRAR